MLNIRRSNARGTGEHGWLHSKHTFSFANYYDPRHMGYRSLRVINEDRIDGGSGFGRHPHRDMEILSYVIEGALVHEDSMGNRAVIKPGEVQRMSAGSGVTHAEFNASADTSAHFFQIWILPEARGGAPGYGQRSFAEELARPGLHLVASREGRDGSLTIQQDADVYVARPKAGEQIRFDVRAGRGAWLHVIRGELSVGDATLTTGDALSADGTQTLDVRATGDAEFILFDLV